MHVDITTLYEGLTEAHEKGKEPNNLYAIIKFLNILT